MLRRKPVFLSGQKTLLGVAFLVALASLRNFPIYLMDELDAALDPENQKVSAVNCTVAQLT